MTRIERAAVGEALSVIAHYMKSDQDWERFDSLAFDLLGPVHEECDGAGCPACDLTGRMER